MSIVKEIYNETSALIDFLKTFPKEVDERDHFIEELDKRLEKRDQLIRQIDQQSLTVSEKKLGAELIKLNKVFSKSLTDVQKEIRLNITELEEKKKTGLKYENPYDGPSSDGIFFDQQS